MLIWRRLLSSFGAKYKQTPTCAKTDTTFHRYLLRRTLLNSTSSRLKPALISSWEDPDVVVRCKKSEHSQSSFVKSNCCFHFSPLLFCVSSCACITSLSTQPILQLLQNTASDNTSSSLKHKAKTEENTTPPAL